MGNIKEYNTMSGRMISEEKDEEGNNIVYNMIDIIRGNNEAVGVVKNIEDYMPRSGRMISEEKDEKGNNIAYNLIDAIRNQSSNGGATLEYVDTEIKSAKEYAERKISNVLENEVYTKEGTENIVESITGYKLINFNDGFYIKTDEEKVDIKNPIKDSAFTYAISECKEGDIFNIKGSGGVAGRLWAFIDSDNKIIKVADNQKTIINDTYWAIKAPAGAVTFIMNTRKSVTHSCIKGCNDINDKTTTSFDENELEYKGIRTTTGEAVFSKVVLSTKEFISENISAIFLTDPKYKMSISIWENGKFKNVAYWYTLGTVYEFDHSNNKKYKISIKTLNEEVIYDKNDVIASVTLIENIRGIIDKGHKGDKNEEIAYQIEKMMTKNYDIAYANSPKPFCLTSYVGNNQNVHPKVLYIPEKFGGHCYWLAYTPYPFSNDLYENPCIAFSDDGYEWTNIEGNPIDDRLGNGYNSDTHLVYNAKEAMLECWYRSVGDKTETIRNELIWRRKSKDGLEWSEAELVYGNYTGKYSNCMSPAVIYDEGLYHIWWVNVDKLEYWTWDGINSVVNVRNYQLDFIDDEGLKYRLWHIDIIKDEEKYILLAMCKGGEASYDTDEKLRKWTLFIATSTDNVNYSKPVNIIYGDSNSWDKYLYRSSIVKDDNGYRIYYSASDFKNNWGMAVTTSKTLEKFIGKVI